MARHLASTSARSVEAFILKPRIHTDPRRLKKGAASLLLAAFVLAPPTSLAQSKMRSVVDETGRRIEVPARIERIVSLAPNLTEILYALGLEDRLVGVTTHCDYPPAAQEKPKVGDVVNPSLEKILELRPDLVLATTAGNRRVTVEQLERMDVPVYGINPHSVLDIFDSIRHVAELAGVPGRGEALVARLQARLARVEVPAQSRPRVLFVVWLEPLVTSGSDTFLNDVLRHAGAESVTSDLGQSWPRLSVEEVIERDPDYLILPHTRPLQASLARIARKDPWRRLRAVRQNHIVWLDEAVLRPGPRIVEAIEELARALHPEATPEVRAEK